MVPLNNSTCGLIDVTCSRKVKGFLKLNFIYFFLIILFRNNEKSCAKVIMQRLSLLNCLKMFMFLFLLGKHPKVGNIFKTQKRAKGVLKTKEEMVNNRVSACQKRFFQKSRGGSRRKWKMQKREVQTRKVTFGYNISVVYKVFQWVWKDQRFVGACELFTLNEIQREMKELILYVLIIWLKCIKNHSDVSVGIS